MPPRILPRPEHTVSRKDIDPDALKVLYRLKNHGFVAYLVGGGVRDLLLGRKPKDFDIGTDAHPQQVKKLFRNCFIVGRRFRLCHVRFGRKVVEVSTFRRAGRARGGRHAHPPRQHVRHAGGGRLPPRLHGERALLRHRDLLGDRLRGAASRTSRTRVIRTIGDPAVRFREDPVRMLRAVALAARLGFTIDRDTLEAIRFLRGEIVKSSPARILDEIYKILRQGASRKTFEMLHERRPARVPAARGGPTRSRSSGERLLGSLGRLDDYRNAGLAAPDELTNAAAHGHAAGAAGRAAAARGRGGRAAARARGVEPARSRDADEAAVDVRRRCRGAAAPSAEDEPERAGAARRLCRCRCRSRGATSIGCASSWPRRAGCARCTRPAR